MKESVGSNRISFLLVGDIALVGGLFGVPRVLYEKENMFASPEPGIVTKKGTYAQPQKA